MSAVTLSELLVAMPDEQREPFARMVNEFICVYAFDVPSAIQAARLFNRWKHTQSPGSRQVVKADCQIAGTALAKGATSLYSEDNQIKTIAGDLLNVVPMPSVEQPELGL